MPGVDWLSFLLSGMSQVRISARHQCCGYGNRWLFNPLIRDKFFRILDFGSRIPNPYCLELRIYFIFWVKILTFFVYLLQFFSLPVKKLTNFLIL
jgi:hypothetical protein